MYNYINRNSIIKFKKDGKFKNIYKKRNETLENERLSDLTARFKQNKQEIFEFEK